MQYYVQLLDQTAVFEILCSVWHCIFLSKARSITKYFLLIIAKSTISSLFNVKANTYVSSAVLKQQHTHDTVSFSVTYDRSIIIEATWQVSWISVHSYSNVFISCSWRLFPLFLPARSTSATLSGSFLFRVSGSIKEKRPAVVEKIPKMITGIPGWTPPNKSTM